MLVLYLVAVVAILAAALYLFLDRRYSTWKRQGVPGPPASALSLTVPKVILGNESVGDVADRIYKKYRESPVAGSYLFFRPVLHIHDPEIIKQVLIKEFQDFSGRVGTLDPHVSPLGNNLFFVGGQKWRDLRLKLAPAFSTGKIKYMFETFKLCSDQMADYLTEKTAAGGGQHTENARSLMTRLFVDTISSVAFGIESNVVKNLDSVFFRQANTAIEPTIMNYFRSLIALFSHSFMMRLRVASTNASTAKFFTELVAETVAFREQNNVDRADLLNMLIQLKNKGYVPVDKDASKEDKETSDAAKKLEKLTLDDIAANVFVFFIAGFESSSSTTSFTLHEMAKNPEILEKALEEIDRVMDQFDGKITYETIMTMPYLEKCISETLRKYPPLSFISRKAVRTRKVPLTDVTVQQGDVVVVPIRALHYDPEYWPNPEQYDPERFSEEQIKKRPSQVYLPFGDGPRICIAGRLGVVQIKTALVTILSKFTVSVKPGETGKVTINPRSFATHPSGSLDVTFHPKTPRTRMAAG